MNIYSAIFSVVLLCGTVLDSAITEFLTGIDPKFHSGEGFSYGVNEQTYFTEVTFVSVDTFATFMHPIPSNEIPFRIAVDENANVYRLFGFERSEYNKLAGRISLTLQKEQIRAYGQFYLDATRIWDPIGHDYVVSLESLIAENRRRMLESEEGVLRYGTDSALTRPELETQIRALFDGVKIGEVRGNETDSVFEADFYVWMYSTGELRWFRLAIGLDGQCDLTADSILAKSVGYYEKYPH